ncbi:MAG: SpoIVB peptidase, partial [Clostridiales bacterium]|nr:SpoIVB peptidase [Clostridiales bacterium]
MQKFERRKFLAILLVAGLLFAGTFLAACQMGQEEAEDAALSVLAETRLVVGGQSVGVKMDVSGVLVVGLEEIETEDGDRINPGLDAGLQLGDRILEIDGLSVNSPEEVQKAVNARHKRVKMTVKRGDQMLTVSITPVKAAADGRFKIGVWVRDRTAGLGTLTYYDPSSGGFGALGHAITDPDTSDILTVEKGVLLRSSVESVKQGEAGDPGEIRGVFYEADEPIGEMTINTAKGIFGTMTDPAENPFYPEPIPIGTAKEGKAYILCTLEGDTIEQFEIDIAKVNRRRISDVKNMVVKVTDPDLLEKTGGIVQG